LTGTGTPSIVFGTHSPSTSVGFERSPESNVNSEPSSQENDVGSAPFAVQVRPSTVVRALTGPSPLKTVAGVEDGGGVVVDSVVVGTGSTSVVVVVTVVVVAAAVSAVVASVVDAAVVVASVVDAAVVVGLVVDGPVDVVVEGGVVVGVGDTGTDDVGSASTAAGAATLADASPADSAVGAEPDVPQATSTSTARKVKSSRTSPKIPNLRTRVSITRVERALVAV
jgi:hypothetical protein